MLVVSTKWCCLITPTASASVWGTLTRVTATRGRILRILCISSTWASETHRIFLRWTTEFTTSPTWTWATLHTTRIFASTVPASRWNWWPRRWTGQFNNRTSRRRSMAGIAQMARSYLMTGWSTTRISWWYSHIGRRCTANKLFRWTTHRYIWCTGS